jgi:beta-1,4-N-acetylglucosaminyltransferase
MEIIIEQIWKKSQVLGCRGMIFVTIGGSPLGFERLISHMDLISIKLEEDVLMQIGYTNYRPINAKYVKNLSKMDFDKYYSCANILICHGGAGSIINALKYDKPTIVVPRLKEYGEIIDDQQIELTRELENCGRIVAVYDVRDLEQKIRDINSFSKEEQSKYRKSLKTSLKKYFDSF